MEFNVLHSPPVVLEKTKSYLRSSRSPVILKANEHGYDSLLINNSSTTLENHTHCKTKQNELYFNAKCYIAFMVLSSLKNY